MSKQTYGPAPPGDFPGTSVTVTGGQSIQDGRGDSRLTLGTPTIDGYGHQIILDDDGLECAVCEMEEEIPAIFKQSSGFYEVVYKLYIFGKFKHTQCEPEFELDNSILNDDTTNVVYDPNRVHWVGGDTYTTNGNDVKWQLPKGQRIMVDGQEYVYKGGNRFMDATTGDVYDATHLQQRHGERADQSIVGAAQMHGLPDDLSIGDHSITIDGSGSLDTVTTDNLAEQEKQQTLRQKFAEKVKNSDRNPLTR